MDKIKSLNIRIDEATKQLLEEISADTGISKSEILRRLIRAAHRKHTKNSPP